MHLFNIEASLAISFKLHIKKISFTHLPHDSRHLVCDFYFSTLGTADWQLENPTVALALAAESQWAGSSLAPPPLKWQTNSSLILVKLKENKPKSTSHVPLIFYFLGIIFEIKRRHQTQYPVCKIRFKE